MTPEEFSAWRRNPRTQEVLARLRTWAERERLDAMEAHFEGALTPNPKRDLRTAYARGVWDTISRICEASPKEMTSAEREGAEGQGG